MWQRRTAHRRATRVGGSVGRGQEGGRQSGQKVVHQPCSLERWLGLFKGPGAGSLPFASRDLLPRLGPLLPAGRLALRAYAGGHQCALRLPVGLCQWGAPGGDLDRGRGVSSGPCWGRLAGGWRVVSWDTAPLSSRVLERPPGENSLQVLLHTPPSPLYKALYNLSFTFRDS